MRIDYKLDKRDSNYWAIIHKSNGTYAWYYLGKLNTPEEVVEMRRNNMYRLMGKGNV